MDLQTLEDFALTEKSLPLVTMENGKIVFLQIFERKIN